MLTPEKVVSESAKALATQSDALRQVADLLEAHPDLPLPYVTSSSSGAASVSWQLVIESIHGFDLAAQKAEATRIIRTLGGKWDKQDGYEDFYFKRSLGLLNLSITVKREAVCERVVTGTETVTIPAKAATPQQVVEQEIVEWRCEPLLAGPVSA